ncbi:hypothetical protein BaRGS_00002234 [Batillaria attramentaria]|uniref:Uncharacterized protein n=1 Tax=Batillaria attramentaria TaxID=370345 RepID=A0ABD0M4J3_9CAEN
MAKKKTSTINPCELSMNFTTAVNTNKPAMAIKYYCVDISYTELKVPHTNVRQTNRHMCNTHSRERARQATSASYAKLTRPETRKIKAAASIALRCRGQV